MQLLPKRGNAYPSSSHTSNYAYASLFFFFKKNKVLKKQTWSLWFIQVKFTDLSIDVFRMLQCLEWEPCGSFALNNGYSAHDESGQNQPNLLKDLRDAALPPNPLKTILNRPSVTHFLTVGSSFSFSFSIVTAFWVYAIFDVICPPL